MSNVTSVPSNQLVAAFPRGRQGTSIRTDEVRARKVARQAAPVMSVLARIARSTDRVVIPAGFLTAKARVEHAAKYKRPLVVAGKYDRSAIMIAAASAAKEHQRHMGGTWAEAMSVCQRAAWTVAKFAMPFAAR